MICRPAQGRITVTTINTVECAGDLTADLKIFDRSVKSKSLDVTEILQEANQGNRCIRG